MESVLCSSMLALILCTQCSPAHALTAVVRSFALASLNVRGMVTHCLMKFTPILSRQQGNMGTCMGSVATTAVQFQKVPQTSRATGNAPMHAKPIAMEQTVATRQVVEGEGSLAKDAKP